MIYCLFSEDISDIDYSRVKKEIEKIEQNIFFVFFAKSLDEEQKKEFQKNPTRIGVVEPEKDCLDDEKVEAFLKSVGKNQGCFVCRDNRVFSAETIVGILEEKQNKSLDIISVVKGQNLSSKFEEVLYKMRVGFYRILGKFFKYRTYLGSTQLIFFSREVIGVIKILPDKAFTSKYNAFIGFNEDVYQVENLPKKIYQPSKKRTNKLIVLSSILLVMVLVITILNLTISLRIAYNFLLCGACFVCLCLWVYSLLKLIFCLKVGEIKK